MKNLFKIKNIMIKNHQTFNLRIHSSDNMSYMIRNQCGKHYAIEEGKNSFNFERCDCGGKLEYSPISKEDPVKKYQHPPTRHSSRIKWKGVLIGLLFLFLSLVISVIILFGNNPK